MKKRGTSLLVAVCVLISTASVAAVGVTSGSADQTKEVSIVFPKTDGEETEMVRYSDHYFFGNSFSYQHELAVLSLGFAMAGFRSADGGSERYDTKHKNIEGTFKQAGFLDLRFDAYDTKPTTSSIASAIGRKPVTNAAGQTKTLVSIVISGSGYEAEWAGNFQIVSDEGTLTQDHAGFAYAASLVLDRMDAYLTQTQTTGEVIYWVTGYSRAAAVSNLVGAALNARVGPQNVFAYTFATPNATTNTSVDVATVNQNIFNILHDGDLVTMLPSEDWGYGRYGQDLYLVSASSKENNAKNQALLMRIDTILGGKEAYYKNGYQRLLMAYFAQKYGKVAVAEGTAEHVVSTSKVAPASVNEQKNGMYALYALLNTVDFSAVGAAHAPKHYLNMLCSREPSPLPIELPFSDVSKEAFYYDAVQWALKKGITEGAGSTTFSPAAPATRAQAVTFLWRANGSPKPTITKTPFRDVAADAYYHDAVLWAVERGLVEGSSTFEPNGTLTRGQAVTLQWRFSGAQQENRRNPFEDVAETDYFYDAVLWATQKGITNGITGVSFQPEGACTRAQLLTFLFRQLS